MKWILVFAILFGVFAEPAMAEKSLGTKIKKAFEPDPTPSSSRKHRKHSSNKATPTPTPSSTASSKRKKSSPTPSPSPTPKSKSKRKKEFQRPDRIACCHRNLSRRKRGPGKGKRLAERLFRLMK
jgi:hypothetical protein